MLRYISNQNTSRRKLSMHPSPKTTSQRKVSHVIKKDVQKWQEWLDDLEGDAKVLETDFRRTKLTTDYIRDESFSSKEALELKAQTGEFDRRSMVGNRLLRNNERLGCAVARA